MGGPLPYVVEHLTRVVGRPEPAGSPPRADYDPEIADAELTHLRLAGWLDALAALVLCPPYDCTDAQTEQLHEVLMAHVAQRD